MDKLIYIIIPIYNVEEYLKKCLDSIFYQTYKNTQVICVNDGSTDKSLDILNEYRDKYSNLIVIDKANSGPASARNEALKIINDFNSSYITFIDADDWVELDYLENLVELIEGWQVDVVCSSFLFATESSSHPYKNIDKEQVVDGLKATELLILDETIQSHSWSKIFKSEIFKDLLFDDSVLFMEDQAFLFKTLYKAKKVYISNYTGYYYRQDNANALTKLKVGNKKAINGLYAYYSVCKSDYKDVDKEILLPASYNALAAAYLMLIPYYKKKKASKEDKEFVKLLKKFLKDKRIVRNYVPNNKNNKIKKTLYLLCPPLYPLFFKIAKRLKK